MSKNKLNLILLLSFILLPKTFVLAAENIPAAPTVFLACSSLGTSAGKQQAFVIKKGESVQIRCMIENTAQEKISGLLLGKQSRGNGVAASSVNISLAGKERQTVTLMFSPVFVPGTYVYTTVLIDKNSQSLSNEAVLVGPLEGESTMTIATATFDKGEYAWGDAATLLLTLSADEGESILLGNKPTTLTVVQLTAADLPCATLIDKQRVNEIKGEYRFRIAQDMQCSNAIRVTLEDEQLKTIDEKTLAISLPARVQAVGEQSNNDEVTRRPFLWLGVIGLTVIAVALVWLRSRRSIDRTTMA